MTRLLLLLFALAGTLVACSSDPVDPPPTVPPAPLPRTITAVAGLDQEGTPGLPVPDSLVVRVTDIHGGVTGVRVTWHVTSGAGTFSPSAVTASNAEGYVRVRFAPGTHRATVEARLEQVALPARFHTRPVTIATYVLGTPKPGCDAACEQYAFHVDGTFTFRTSTGYRAEGSWATEDTALRLQFEDARWVATAVPSGDALDVRYNATMQMADFEDGLFRLTGPATAPWLYRVTATGGQGQDGRAGVPLAAPFTVQVTDHEGRAVYVHPPLHWRVESGTGELQHPESRRASAALRPTRVGPIRVTASLPGAFTPPATFDVQVPCAAPRVGLVLWRSPSGMDDRFLQGHGYPATTLTVPLGTTVDWFNAGDIPDYTARIHSTAVPAGASSFDSGVLPPSGSFGFTPGVEGTWRYMDAVSGLQATLVVAGTLDAPVCAP